MESVFATIYDSLNFGNVLFLFITLLFLHDLMLYEYRNTPPGPWTVENETVESETISCFKKSTILLSKCAQFRDELEFIDVRLKVGECVFPAHRIVLAANSDYFHAMFTDGMKESNQEVIELKDESISRDALRIVMDCIYTGDLHVNEVNVFEVLAAADHLQVTSVVKQCCGFLKREFNQRFNLHNYCLLCTVADRHGLRNLQEAAEHKMASKYKDICESKEFLTHISADQLLSLLSRDDLSAPSETFVFKSVMQWIKHKKEERMAVAAKVIGAIRLGLVDIKIVIEELRTEAMQRVPEINALLQELVMHNYMPSRNSKLAVEKTKPRSMSPVRMNNLNYNTFYCH